MGLLGYFECEFAPLDLFPETLKAARQIFNRNHARILNR